MRYLLGQVNVLWHVFEDRVPGHVPQAEDLRFNTDWTTEHIYAQAADPSLAPKADAWFNDRAFSRKHCLGNLLPLHPALQQRAGNEAFSVKRETYEISSNVLSRAASRLSGFQAEPLTDEQRDAFDSEVTYLPQRFLQRHARIKTLIARHIFGRDSVGVPAVGFSVLPLPDVPPRDGTEIPAPPFSHETSRDEGPPRQRQRLNPQPQLPLHLRIGGAKSSLKAYNTALDWIVDRVERDRVKTAIDRLAAEALAAVPNDPSVTRYLTLAGETDLDKGNSKYIIHTRRVDIVSRFFGGYVTLSELEGQIPPSPVRATESPSFESFISPEH